MSGAVRRYVDGKLVGGVTPAAPGAVFVPGAQTTATVRTFLLEQMALAAQGKLDAERVRNVCALAEQVYKMAKLEIDAAEMLERIGQLPPMQLGHDAANE